MGSISVISVLAGVLVAYGAVLVLLAIAAGIGSALDLETAGISDNEWRDVGVGAAVVLGTILFASYLFGGYVAGRMGRRAGLLHGLLVFVLGLVVIAAVAAITSASADGDAITRELQSQGVPTALDDWRDIGLLAGLGVLAAMLLGALLGGSLGERWHGKLVTRALDPEVRPRGETAAPEPSGPPVSAGSPLHGESTTAASATPVGGDDTAIEPVVRHDDRAPVDRQDPDPTLESVHLSDAERTAAARARVEQELADQDRTRTTPPA